MPTDPLDLRAIESRYHNRIVIDKDGDEIDEVVTEDVPALCAKLREVAVALREVIPLAERDCLPTSPYPSVVWARALLATIEGLDP